MTIRCFKFSNVFLRIETYLLCQEHACMGCGVGRMDEKMELFDIVASLMTYSALK